MSRAESAAESDPTWARVKRFWSLVCLVHRVSPIRMGMRTINKKTTKINMDPASGEEIDRWEFIRLFIRILRPARDFHRWGSEQKSSAPVDGQGRSMDFVGLIIGKDP